MYRTIKYLTLGIFLLVILSGCNIYAPIDDDIHNNDYSVKEEFSYQITASGQQYLKVEGANGVITVNGTTESDLRIRGDRIVASDSYSDANEHLDYLRVEVTTSDEFILVRTIQPSNSHGRTYEVDYQIEVPWFWDVAISQLNGPVHVDLLDGTLWCDLVNGNLELTRHDGSLFSGITNGNFLGEMNLPESGVCDVHLVNGNIDLSIPEETQANLHAGITNGSISIVNLPLQYISQSRSHVSGILGNGNAEISLGTVNGIIMVRGI
jgi:DUF4097 and DUF4098 domain-containing protein YvlB